MRRNKIIVSCLLPAYMLLVLHTIIPHHHHFSASNGPLNFHHGFNAHLQDHHTGEHHDADSHGHTAHFVHSPEFGIAMLQPTANWIEVNAQKDFNAFTHQFPIVSIVNHPECNSNWFPESPPLHNFTHSSVLSLRGPPALTNA